MALDEALLQCAAAGGPPVIRFYAWQEPTLSLGYFQRYADRAAHAASRNSAVVRRATGGGAILHDRELTYSCVLPAGHALARRPDDLYSAIHESILIALADCGLYASLGANVEASAGAQVTHGPPGIGCGNPHSDLSAIDKADAGSAINQPFLCFARRTPGDVLLEGWKVAGSAQRRHRSAVLQHGSILFERSPFAPEIPGIHDISGRRLDVADFALRLRFALTARAGFDLAFQPIYTEINERAASLETSKFAQDHWIRLR